MRKPRKWLILTILAVSVWGTSCLMESVLSPTPYIIPLTTTFAHVKPATHKHPSKPSKQYIGTFTLTGYCPCAKCTGKWQGCNTASVTVPTAGRTVGADWSVLPAGTQIYIAGIGYRTVEDKPAKWIIKRYAGKIIDVFCKDHATALKIGRQVVKVYLSDN